MTNQYTQIQFIDTFGTTGPQGIIDVDTDSQFAIDFAISDIREPFSRKGTKSYNFKIVGNKAVNQLLNHYYEINSVDGTYNHNKLQKVAVLRNGVIVLDNAFMHLKAINKLPSTDIYGDQVVNYEVTVGDDATSFFTAITNRFLDQLDFNDMNHTYNAANVVATFPYVAQRDNALGTGGYKYVLPWTDQSTYKLEECRPAISVFEYWNRIHADAGYRWNWDGFDSSTIRMDKLWIPYNGDTPKMKNQEQYEVAAETSTGFTRTGYHYGSGYPDDVFSTNFICDVEVVDDFNLYNPVTGEYTSNLNTGTGTIEVTFEVEYSLVINNPSGGTAYLTSGSTLGPSGDFGWKYRSYIWMRNETNGTYSSQVPFKVDELITTPSTYYTLAPGNNTISSGVVRTPTLAVTSISSADVLKTYIGSDGTFDAAYLFRSAPTGVIFPISPTTTLNITSVKMIILPRLDTFGYNSIIEMNSFVPRKIKQSDFIKSIANMYNLVMEVDPSDDRTINYKPRDQYYDAGTAKDWTHKLCTDKNQTIEFISDANKRKIILSYKPDTDAANKTYLDENKEIYGQLEFELQNQNTKDIENKEIVFSPTPIGYTNFGTYNPLWPAMAPKCNIRILIDGGVQETGNGGEQTYSIVDGIIPPYAPVLTNVTGTFTGTGTGSIGYTGTVSSGVAFVTGPHAFLGAATVPLSGTIDTWPGFTFFLTAHGFVTGGYFSGTGNLTSSTVLPPVTQGEFDLDEYPMLTHLDNPNTPQFDINFGLCDQYYFPFTNVTNNNLYSMFWRRTMGQIDNGKLLTAYFMLNEYDISILKLNDKIFVKDTWYNINKLQYDPNSLGPTKVVLMTIDDNLSLGRKVGRRPPKSSNGAISESVILHEISRTNMNAKNWNYADSSVLVLGEGNVIPSNVKNTMIVGDYHIDVQSDTIYTENLSVSGDLLVGGVPLTSILAAQDLQTTLVNGNFTGGSDIIVTNGDKIKSDIGLGYIAFDALPDSVQIISDNTTSVSSVFLNSNATLSRVILNATDDLSNYYGECRIEQTTSVITAQLYVQDNTLSCESALRLNQDPTETSARLQVTNGTTPSAVYMEPNYIEISQYSSGGLFKIYSETSNIQALYQGMGIEGSNDAQSIQVQDNGTFATSTAGTTNAAAVYINSASGDILAGVTNSAIFCGSDSTISAGDAISIFGDQNANQAGVRNFISGYQNTNTAGDNNFIACSGNINTAGNYNAIFGSTNSNMSGNGNLIFGFTNVSAGNYNIIGGTGNTIVSPDYGHAIFGANNTNTDGHPNLIAGANNENIDGECNILSGISNTNINSCSITTGYGNENTHVGGIMYGAINVLSKIGSSGMTTMGAITTNATPTPFAMDGISVFDLFPDTAYRVKLTAIATDVATGDCIEWEGMGIIKNVAGTTSLVGAGITMTSTIGDASLAAATIVVTADNTFDTLVLTATGIAATTINWVCNVEYVKVYIA